MLVVASLGLEMRIVTELTVLELRGHSRVTTSLERTNEGHGYDCCTLVILDRVELVYFGQLRKDTSSTRSQIIIVCNLYM